MTPNVLITGGAGFIGSHLADLLLAKGHRVVVLDLLTYAGSLANLEQAKTHDNFVFQQGDIGDMELVSRLLREHAIDWVFHAAAESHVDNSISGPKAFLETNVGGTFTMLEAARQVWSERGKPDGFKFVHVSTDEVYGALGMDDPAFTEQSQYKPNSPYSASKAASDHFARAWQVTYGLPVVITNCSNNFGPRQNSEKLIPTVIRTALAGKPIPIYGTGQNVRDWLSVSDHCNALYLAAARGAPGQSYCIGGGVEMTNLELATAICASLDRVQPRGDGKPYAKQLTFVTDRLGHDFRYAIDCELAERELGYTPQTDFNTALDETIRFYL